MPKDEAQGPKLVKQDILNNVNICSSNDAVTWAAYHALTQIEEDQPALTALLPLFYEKAATPAIVKHGMDVLKQAVTFLNPDQIPIIAVDRPLFALSKMVQWKWPSSHGEQAYIVMLGELQVEMALWNVLGDLLDGSRWIAALSEAEVGLSGVADSFLKAAHLRWLPPVLHFPEPLNFTKGFPAHHDGLVRVLARWCYNSF